MLKTICLILVAAMMNLTTNARTQEDVPFIQRAFSQIRTPVLKAFNSESMLKASLSEVSAQSVVSMDESIGRRHVVGFLDLKWPGHEHTGARYDEATSARKRAIGTKAIIVGSILLVAGAAVAHSIGNREYSGKEFPTDYLMVVGLGGAGLGFLIPGIVLRIKYRK